MGRYADGPGRRWLGQGPSSDAAAAVIQAIPRRRGHDLRRGGPRGRASRCGPGGGPPAGHQRRHPALVAGGDRSPGAWCPATNASTPGVCGPKAWPCAPAAAAWPWPGADGQRRASRRRYCPRPGNRGSKEPADVEISRCGRAAPQAHGGTQKVTTRVARRRTGRLPVRPSEKGTAVTATAVAPSVPRPPSRLEPTGHGARIVLATVAIVALLAVRLRARPDHGHLRPRRHPGRPHPDRHHRRPRSAGMGRPC